MKRKQFCGAILLPLFLLIFSGSSCKKEVGDVLTDDNMQSSSATAAPVALQGRMLESQLLKSVRQTTSRFNSTTQAIQAGYMPDDHCVSSPAGGMGYHWVNQSLVNPVFDPLQPEVMLYATGPGGNLRLVAVEYIVINVGQPAPMFDGIPFMEGGTPVPVPHWSLHVWVHEPNPSGMFTPFNPNITCP